MIESEDLVQEERARKAAVRKSKMDANLDAESAHLQEKKGVNNTGGTGWYIPDQCACGPFTFSCTIL